MSMEMDLMTPILLRQSVAVSSVRVTVTSLHGAQLDRTDVTTVERSMSLLFVFLMLSPVHVTRAGSRRVRYMMRK